MEKYGYKTKRSMFKNMKSVSIQRKENQIIFGPSHHEKLEVWGRTKGDIIIPANSSPAEVGAALRLAFSRCTG